MAIYAAAGAAQPVVVVTDTETQGDTAVPVFGYTTTPTDRPILGGKAWRVKVLTSGDLKHNGGKYQLRGELQAMAVYTDPKGLSNAEGNIAIAVFPINVWP